MRAIENAVHGRHAPTLEVEEGAITPPFEVPGRYDAIRQALAAHGGFAFETAPPATERDVIALHDPAYVAYLREASRDASTQPAAFVMPSVFPYGPVPSVRSAKARHGMYCFDTYTPIVSGTFDAALAGAGAALRGAELLASGGERGVYVLTRPPGHHAERARCGGYSYLNNAALAANRLAAHGPVAVLDLDVHHGNGTQHLFYDRADVFVASIHGDPAHLYPYFSGFAEETGTGAGLGRNLNVPLPLGSGEREYLAALATACESLARVRPAFLVVSLGADAHESDPIGGMKLPTESFALFGRRVKEMNLPTLVVQEGGYSLTAIGPCTVGFLDAMVSA